MEETECLSRNIRIIPEKNFLKMHVEIETHGDTWQDRV